MKIKKVPMRTCVITKEKCEKKELIRVVRTPEGNVIVDLTGKVSGRGAYLKKDINVINKAQTSKALNRILEVEVSDEIFNELRSIIEDEKN